MMEKDNSPVLVTGASRSGASMIAGVFQLCGAFLGNIDKPNRNSPRGMYENNWIHDRVVAPYFQNQGVDPFGQYPLPDTSKLPIPSDWADTIKGVMYDEGYTSGVWGYKSSKLALMWPVWHYAFPNAKWIIVRRRTGDILNSCLQTSFMKAFKQTKNRQLIGAKTEREAWTWWVHQYESRFVDMLTAGLNCKVLWPERMVKGDYVQIYETIEWLGLKWESKVLEYIDPKFWKVRGR